MLVSQGGERKLTPLIYLYMNIKRSLAPQGIFHIFYIH
jgi:hypothetical protein